MNHIWNRKFRWISLVSIVVLIGANGCSAIHPRTSMGTGTYSHVTRNLSWTYPYTLEKVWAATLAGLAELNYEIKEQVFDGLGGRLQAQAAVGSRLSLKARPEGKRSTYLKLHVHRFLNRHESERVHEIIHRKLNEFK